MLPHRMGETTAFGGRGLNIARQRRNSHTGLGVYKVRGLSRPLQPSPLPDRNGSGRLACKRDFTHRPHYDALYPSTSGVRDLRYGGPSKGVKKPARASGPSQRPEDSALTLGVHSGAIGCTPLHPGPLRCHVGVPPVRVFGKKGRIMLVVPNLRKWVAPRALYRLVRVTQVRARRHAGSA